MSIGITKKEQEAIDAAEAQERSEGTYVLTLDDGSLLEFSSCGDDMTFTLMSLVRGAK